ncbi:hypothetical protein Hrd1104_01495 [Halorhabdus sp. CBA1104]|nr:hypothetical protein Hrd1104_01495 [Halorhabdus sp. CBA1104]
MFNPNIYCITACSYANTPRLTSLAISVIGTIIFGKHVCVVVILLQDCLFRTIFNDWMFFSGLQINMSFDSVNAFCIGSFLPLNIPSHCGPPFALFPVVI